MGEYARWEWDEAMAVAVAGREAAITLDKIEAAVVAMEHLFCGILDVSKLDAGVVVPAPEVGRLPGEADGSLVLADDVGMSVQVWVGRSTAAVGIWTVHGVVWSRRSRQASAIAPSSAIRWSASAVSRTVKVLVTVSR